MRLLDPTWRLLGSTWRLLGVTLELLGANLALQTGLQAQLGLQTGLQVQLGASWIDFWCSCNPQNRALAYTRAQISCFCTLAFQDCLLSLLGASCSSLVASWVSLWAQLGASYAPLGPNLAALGQTLELFGAYLDSTWLSKLASKRNLASKLASKCNLALLGSIFGALATLRIELSPAQELHFHAFASWRFITFRKHDLLAYFA